MLAAYMGAEITEENPYYRVKMSGQSFLFDPKRWEFIDIEKPDMIPTDLVEVLREVDRLDFAETVAKRHLQRLVTAAAN